MLYIYISRYIYIYVNHYKNNLVYIMLHTSDKEKCQMRSHPLVEKKLISIHTAPRYRPTLYGNEPLSAGILKLKTR